MSSLSSMGPDTPDGGSGAGTGAPRPRTRRELFTLGRRAEEGHWIRIHRAAMACRFEILLDGADDRHAAAAREALDEADRLEAALSVFRETSELSRVNRTAAQGPVTVDADLFALLDRCRAPARADRGRLRHHEHALEPLLGVPEARGAAPVARGHRGGAGAGRHVRGPLGRGLTDDSLRARGHGAQPRQHRQGIRARSDGGPHARPWSRPCPALRGRQQRGRGRRPRRRMDGGHPLTAGGEREAGAPPPARRRPRDQRRGRAVLRGGRPALRARHRSAHGLARLRAS